MKRLLAALLCAALLLPALAFGEAVPGAEPAARAPLTAGDLAALRDQVISELQSRPERKPVQVPAGSWTVGEDFPAGSWSFRHSGGWISAYVEFSFRVGPTTRREEFRLTAGQEIGRGTPAEGTVLQLDQAVVMAPPSFASVTMKETAVPREYRGLSLASRSADDLIRLQRELLSLVVLSPDCESVCLPAGIWTIGEDLPAGTWDVSCAKDSCSFRYYKDAVTFGRSWISLAPRREPKRMDLKEGWQLFLDGPVDFSPVLSGE